MSAQRDLHISPEQAAQAAGVSRWTVMRAIKSLRLKAIRDNRGNWRIARADFEAWRSAQGPSLSAAQSPAQDAEGELRALLAAAKVRAESAERARDVAEADRDRWQAMAERLAARRRFWPFG
jgi:excisionase family DNA binding protein